MSHVSDMNSDLVIAIFELSEGQGIIKVLGISRVNCKCKDVSEIATTRNLVSCNLFRNVVCSILYILLKTIWQSIFCKVLQIAMAR